MINRKGFTLIELLVVIGILAILLAITLIAINPARQFGQANDTRQRSDVLQILNGIHQFVAENNGQLPATVAGLAVDTPTLLANTTALSPLCAQLVTNYLPALPVIPTLNTPNITDCDGPADDGVWGSTGYSISRDAADRITVSGGNDVNGVAITVTR
ncbi:type II secretion system protein [Candidatus Roizmanbacteria bacterium]|nr:type II secretion system protein [Candidatus Roizmanbacteria bacterium]